MFTRYKWINNQLDLLFKNILPRLLATAISGCLNACEYVFKVVDGVECPSRLAIVLTSAPLEIHIEAFECLSECKDTLGSLLRFKNLSKAVVGTSG